jgi:phage-related protein
MEKEIQGQFGRIHESIERLATMVAESFASMTKYINGRFDSVDERFNQVDQQLGLMQSEIRELRSEIRSIRTELERMPDTVDAMYGSTINDLFDRIAIIEKKLGIT